MFNHHTKEFNNGKTDTRKLIGYYQLAKDGLDRSGNGYHLTTNGIIPYTIVNGRACAGPFTVANFYSAPQSLMDVMTAATVGLTFEFSFYGIDASNYWMLCSNSGGDEWGALYAGTNTNLWWRHNGPGQWVYTGPAVPNVWKNAAFVGFGTTLQMWINGSIVPATEISTPGNWKFGAATIFNIGKHNTGANPFNGYLSEIKIWSVAQNAQSPIPTIIG